MQMEAAGTSLITRGITESDLHSITSGGATVQELTCKSDHLLIDGEGR